MKEVVMKEVLINRFVPILNVPIDRFTVKVGIFGLVDVSTNVGTAVVTFKLVVLTVRPKL
jgi:hypothetical protein